MLSCVLLAVSGPVQGQAVPRHPLLRQGERQEQRTEEGVPARIRRGVGLLRHR